MRHLLAALGFAAAAVLSAAPAYADPAADPHMPNMQAGYCPGGGMGSQISLAYCDGVPYPACAVRRWCTRRRSAGCAI